MKAGNLVKLTRATIGLPAGSIGLVIRKDEHVYPNATEAYGLFWIRFVGGRECRFLSRDLERVE
jgi:hypothetical protein